MKKCEVWIVTGAIILAILWAGCKTQETQRSFITALDEIDALIAQEQYKDAVTALVNIEKRSPNVWTTLGVYRRYKTLGETDRGEKLLRRCLKKNHANIEVTAVLTKLLIDKEENFGLDEAVELSKPLIGTKYGSLHSQALFQKTQLEIKNSPEGDAIKPFMSDDYLQIYTDAYNASSNVDYLKNAAVLLLTAGKYNDAFNIRPQSIETALDGYFWALVCYDAKCFGDAVNYLDDAIALSKNAGERARLLSLETDAYTALHEEESAQRLRKGFISSLNYENGQWVLPYEADLAGDENIYSAIFTNAARFAFDNNDYDGCNEYITFVVNRWPLFVAGLSLYCDFAYETQKAREETIIQKQIRQAGEATLEMEAFDRRPRIPLTDAAYKVDQALKTTGDPLLYVLALDLKYKMDKNLSVEDKCRDIWNVLEENMTAPGVYPDELFDYAVNYLLNNKKKSDAWYLYKSCMNKKHSMGLDVKETIPNTSAQPIKNLANITFFDTIIAKNEELSQSNLEYAAFFATTLGFSDYATLLYEIVCSKSAHPTNYAFINLANLYSSTDNRPLALETLQKTVGRCTNMTTKSLVMYRIAYLYYTAGDAQNAKRSAEYSITLNPRNADARLLLSRIKNEQ